MNDARYRERLAVYTSTGRKIVEWRVIGDVYGMGVFYDFRPDYPGVEVVRELLTPMPSPPPAARIMVIDML